MKAKSAGTEIFYDMLGDGPDVVLLHAFPVNHGLWRPVAERLATRYRVLLIDLRGHGSSGIGEGPATMEKHAADVALVCDDAGVGKAIFGGVSIGGYVLFEFWRRLSERVRGLMLCDTRAQADSDEARSARLQGADKVEKDGPDQFLDGMVPKLLGVTTLTNRPDLVNAARAMMADMSAPGIAAVLRGMAARPDSVATLRTINVPTLLLFGEEDGLTPPAEGELIRSHVTGARFQVIPRAGHYAVFEQQDAANEVVRKFLDEVAR